MKALLDMPVSPSLVGIPEAHGHTGYHASDLGMAAAPDSDLLTRAREAGWIIITADLDFPRLLALSAAAGPGIILFRGGTYSDSEMRGLLERVLLTVAPEILESSICVVDKQRIRLTTLPLDRSS